MTDPSNRSPPGSSDHGILQARILKWVAMSFSRGSSQPRPLALQADSLQSEPPGKPWRTVWKLLKTKVKSKSRTTIEFSNPTPGHVSGENHSLKRYAYTVSVKLLSRVRLFAIPWTVAYQAPPSTELCRQECWSGLSFPSPGDLPDPGSDPRSPHCSQTHYCLSHQEAPTLLCLKWITRTTRGTSAQSYAEAYMGGEFGEEWLHAYEWLSLFVVHLKLSQHS